MIRTQPSRTQKDRVKVTFVLPGDHNHGPTSVVGDFNNWDPLAHPFKKRSNNTYSVAAELPRGTQVAFRYLSGDGRWSNEPDAAQDGPNSVLLT
jgi:1,4-alpha-glucan branching enzyme